MDKHKVISLIETKIQEHQAEVNGATKDISKLSGPEGQRRSAQLINASKKVILKDKVIFHKAAMLALHDLLEELRQL